RIEDLTGPGSAQRGPRGGTCWRARFGALILARPLSRVLIRPLIPAFVGRLGWLLAPLRCLLHRWPPLLPFFPVRLGSTRRLSVTPLPSAVGRLADLLTDGLLHLLPELRHCRLEGLRNLLLERPAKV